MLIKQNKDFQLRGSVIALGTFDGVHLAHRVLLDRAETLAESCAVPSIVSTFHDHPLLTIAPQRVPKLLTTFEEKAMLIEQAGIDYLYAPYFDRSVMAQPPEAFVYEMVQCFHPKYIICGYNYSFGAMGSGSPDLLDQLGKKLNFDTVVIPKVQLNGMNVSSTEVRKALQSGQDAKAVRLLGHSYRFMLVSADKNLYCMKNTEKQSLSEGAHHVIINTADCRIPAVIRNVSNNEWCVEGLNDLPDQIYCELSEGI